MIVRVKVGRNLGFDMFFQYFCNKAWIRDRPIVVQIIVIKTPFLRIGVTRSDLMHCGQMPDAQGELNRSVREGKIEFRHSIKSLEGMGSSSHDFGAELRMHSFTVNCYTFKCRKSCSSCPSNMC